MCGLDAKNFLVGDTGSNPCLGLEASMISRHIIPSAVASFVEHLYPNSGMNKTLVTQLPVNNPDCAWVLLWGICEMGCGCGGLNQPTSFHCSRDSFCPLTP